MENKQIPFQKENVGWIIALHAFWVLAIWASPFLFPWWVIVVGIAVYFLQLFLLGDCVLTRAQFETKNKRGPTFYYYLLIKMGFNPNMQRVRWIADNVMPWVILGVALVIQVGLEYKPVF